MFLTLLAGFPIVGALTSQRLVLGVETTLGINDTLHLSTGAIFQALNGDGLVKWSFDPNSQIVNYKEGLDGTIHIIAQSTLDTNSTHYAIDGMDGSIQWQRASLDMRECQNSPMLDLRHMLLISDSNSYLLCLENVPMVSSGIRIAAVDAAGAWKWTEYIPNAIDADLGPYGGLLVRTEPLPWSTEVPQHKLSVLEPENGAMKWTVTIHPHTDFEGWALSEDSVFVASYRADQFWNPLAGEMDLLRLNGEDGSILWNVSLGEFSGNGSWPRIPFTGSNGEVYVYSPVWEGQSYAYDLLAFDVHGNNLSALPCPATLFTHSTRQRADGTEEDIFATRTHTMANLTNFIANNGSHWLWNASIAGYLDIKSIGHFGTVFATDSLRKGGIAIRDGHEAWRAQFFSKALMAKDGTTYLLVHDVLNNPSIVAMDMTGSQMWDYPIPHQSVESSLNAQISFVV